MTDLAQPTNFDIIQRINELERRLLKALSRDEQHDILPEYMTAPLSEDGMYFPSYLKQFNEEIRQKFPSGWMTSAANFRNTPVQLIRGVFWSQVIKDRLKDDPVISARFEQEKQRVFPIAVTYYGSGMYIIPLDFPPAQQAFAEFDVIVPGSYVPEVADHIQTDEQLKAAIFNYYRSYRYL
jgi:hypothetical protein